MQMQKIKLPKICERIIGVTLPKNDIVHIVGYDKYVELDLSSGSIVKESESDAENTDKLAANGQCIGLNWDDVLHDVFNYRLKCNFRQSEDTQTVCLMENGLVVQNILAQSLSGDWFKYSFDIDGKYIIICDPYDLEIYKF